jgi:hypothetical protein
MGILDAVASKTDGEVFVKNAERMVGRVKCLTAKRFAELALQQKRHTPWHLSYKRSGNVKHSSAWQMGSERAQHIGLRSIA